MSTAPRYIPRYTLEDYAQWQGAWELIDGVPIAMTPSPFGPHERVVSELARRIGNELVRHRCPCHVYTNLDWIVASHTVVRPDVMVVCGEQPERHLQRPPTVAVEVLSDSTRNQDSTVKRELYRENQVPHYLLVDPARRFIEWITEEESRVMPSDEDSELALRLSGECSIRIECGHLFD